MRSRSKYSASIAWLSARSCEMTCRQPPVVSAGKITVLPRSAAMVDTVAWLHARLESQPFRDAQHVIDDVSMLDADALWTAGRTARVNHIREVRRLDLQRLVRASLRGRPIESSRGRQPARPRSDMRQQAAVGEHDRDAGIRQHERDPLLRIARIDGHVRGAGLQDAEHADDHLDRALDEQADEHLRTRAQHPQVMRQLRRRARSSSAYVNTCCSNTTASR